MKRSLCMLFSLLIGASQVLAQPPKPATVQGSVHSIEMPFYEPALPEASNRKLFLNNCTMCHSARYVLMQFPLPRAKWTAEVNKMQTAFGCPLEISNRKKLVDYLMLIRGSQASKPKGRKFS